MKVVYHNFRVKLLLIIALILTSIAAIIAAPSKLALAGADYSKVYAVYGINFNGINLGKFKVWSNFSKSSYSMLGKGKFSILRGVLFEWTGTTQSSGRVTKSGPKPIAFSFDFKSSAKNEQLQMRFTNNTVSQVLSDPPPKISQKRIPVKEEHLKGVVDPMSALMILTSTLKKISSEDEKNLGAKVCNHEISIFDGRERYDLMLSHKKTTHLDKNSDNGYSGPAYICRIKYVPISGHMADRKATKFMEETKDIEVWLAPMLKADLFVPYYIVVPTPIGYISLTSEVFQIERPGHGRVAFVH